MRLRIEALAGGGQARVDADQRAAIRLVGALRRVVGRLPGQRQQRRGRSHQQLGKGQLAAQRVHLGTVMRQRRRRLDAHGVPQRVGGDEGVAVAVAADPAADAEERRQPPALAGKALRQLPLGLQVHARQLVEEGLLEVADAVAHFVDHVQPHGAQHARLPHAQHGIGQAGGVVLGLVGRELQAVALVQQAGDQAVVVDQALALHLGGVRGQHRRQQRVAQQVGQGLGAHAVGGQAVERVRQAAGARRRAGDVVRAAAAHVVHVFGDVGQLQEVAERAHHDLRLVLRQRVEQRRHLGARLGVVAAHEAHRRAAHLLDQREQGLALLLAQGVAEHAAKQADVVAQGQFLVGTVDGRGWLRGGVVHGQAPWLARVQAGAGSTGQQRQSGLLYGNRRDRRGNINNHSCLRLSSRDFR